MYLHGGLKKQDQFNINKLYVDQNLHGSKIKTLHVLFKKYKEQTTSSTRTNVSYIYKLFERFIPLNTQR